jgi:hypothetical protein
MPPTPHTSRNHLLRGYHANHRARFGDRWRQCDRSLQDLRGWLHTRGLRTIRALGEQSGGSIGAQNVPAMVTRMVVVR